MNNDDNTEKLPLPEKIIFVNGLTNEITREENFADVPESIRFLPNENGEIEPVVKIVEITADDRRVIKQMGRGDVVLKSTVQIPE